MSVLSCMIGLQIGIPQVDRTVNKNWIYGVYKKRVFGVFGDIKNELYEPYKKSEFLQPYKKIVCVKSHKRYKRGFSRAKLIKGRELLKRVLRTKFHKREAGSKTGLFRLYIKRLRSWLIQRESSPKTSKNRSRTARKHHKNSTKTVWNRGEYIPFRILLGLQHVNANKNTRDYVIIWADRKTGRNELPLLPRNWNSSKG